MGSFIWESVDFVYRFPTEECRVKFDQESRSRGFAFVSFYTKETLEECFDAQPHYIDGKKVELRKARQEFQAVKKL